MKSAIRVGVAACLLGAAVLRPAHAIDTNIQSYVCQRLDDFAATVSVISVNERELGKISRDALLLYKIGTIKMKYSEPNRVRIDGSKDGTKVVVILDHANQLVNLNGVKIRRNMGNSPGKRKSLMDVGLVSEYYLTYVNAKFIREGTVDGVPCAVFDMSYKDREDTSHHTIYIDPKTKVVRKREAYSQEGKRQATYYYKNIKEVAPGIWFPTRLEAENTDHVICGVTGYNEVRVNVGLPDSTFRL